ncbi:hypothetical protein CALCODRAFT_185995 [Calocera cornea HHB12733]|uniref:Hydrophobin n=1 Tax=Calocera cornea HHB12733 TaxID=1353952 RepID=A0A165HP13_9BASI|nr:hypothetical protein CALCODRAFT_185995 [Calocera cornea HHB12733]
MQLFSVLVIMPLLATTLARVAPRQDNGNNGLNSRCRGDFGNALCCDKFGDPKKDVGLVGDIMGILVAAGKSLQDVEGLVAVSCHPFVQGWLVNSCLRSKL